eukprot:g69503.t1
MKRIVKSLLTTNCSASAHHEREQNKILRNNKKKFCLVCEYCRRKCSFSRQFPAMEACPVCQKAVVPAVEELRAENKALREEIVGLKEKIKAFDNRITSFSRTMGQLTLHVNAIVSGLHKLDAHGIRAEAEKRRKRREDQEKAKIKADEVAASSGTSTPELNASPVSSTASSISNSPSSSPSSSAPSSPSLSPGNLTDDEGESSNSLTPLSIHSAYDSKGSSAMANSPRVAASPRKFSGTRSRSFSKEGSTLRRRNSEKMESSGALTRNTPGLWKITTWIGSTSGYKDGNRVLAQMESPGGVAVGPKDQVYFSDTGNHRVRVMQSNGNVFTLAGTGQPGSDNGAGSKASFSNLRGLVVDKEGRVYLADNDKIRSISPKGVVTTLLDGAAEKAFFQDVARDAQGTLYFSDMRSHRIFKVTKRSVGVVAGSGQPGMKNEIGEKASFNAPTGLAVDEAGENLYVCDSGNNMIRQVNLLTGQVTSLAGSGTAGDTDGYRHAATFVAPQGIALDTVRSVLYVVDASHRLRQVAIRTGDVVSLAGTGSAGEEDGISPSFNNPMAL